MILSHSTKKASTGFSLVEVVLAMGIVSFTFLGLVALIPTGLKMSREAADATTESQIIQFVRNQMQLTTYTGLATACATPLYFTADGLPTTANDPNEIYKVNLTTANVAMADAVGNTTDLSSTSAQIVRITITNRSASAANTFSIVVPNTGS